MALSLLSTEGLARASARRPWFVVAAWVAVIVASVVAIGTLLASGLTTEVSLTNNPESQRAENLLEDRLRGPEPTNEIVIVRSAGATVDDPQFRRTVEDIYADISALGPGIVASGTNFYQSNDPSLVSEDRHTTILPFVMAGDHEEAEDNIGGVLDIVDEAETAPTASRSSSPAAQASPMRSASRRRKTSKPVSRSEFPSPSSSLSSSSVRSSRPAYLSFWAYWRSLSPWASRPSLARLSSSPSSSPTSSR